MGLRDLIGGGGDLTDRAEREADKASRQRQREQDTAASKERRRQQHGIKKLASAVGARDLQFLDSGDGRYMKAEGTLRVAGQETAVQLYAQVKDSGFPGAYDYWTEMVRLEHDGVDLGGLDIKRSTNFMSRTEEHFFAPAGHYAYEKSDYLQTLNTVLTDALTRAQRAEQEEARLRRQEDIPAEVREIVTDLDHSPVAVVEGQSHELGASEDIDLS